MAQDDDVLIIDDDSTEAAALKGRWKVAIVDDEPAVHDATRFALYDHVLNGFGLELISAYTAAEARALLQTHRDTAVVLLDVVMETDTAGLELVSYIRRELKNETVRIILRTGQPGQAPERDVIVDYDINDYKSKTELTATKLFTAMTAALRSYQQLKRMVETRRGLEIIIDATATLGDFRSLQRLAEGVLTQLSSLLAIDCAGMLVLREDGRSDGPFSVLAGSGCYRSLIGRNARDHLDRGLLAVVETTFATRRTIFEADRTLLYIGTESGSELVVVLDSGKDCSDTDRALIEIFCSRLSVSVDNVLLYEKLQEANRTLERRVEQRTEELAAANRRLSEAWQRAKRARAVQSEILGTVAHDLKNPLSVILGRTEILKHLIDTKAFATDAGLTQVEQIRKSVTRLSTMANTLVQEGMADAMDITIRSEPGDIAQLVEDVVEANRPLAERKNQPLVIATPAALPADFDYDRLRDALDNLVSNAIKYSPFGGTITVAADTRPEGIAIVVADEGPGLQPNDFGRLFERFQRLSAKPTGGESSTGLGLSIAKRIVDLHGGTIAAESPGPGAGTRFIVILPAGRDPEPA